MEFTQDLISLRWMMLSSLLYISLSCCCNAASLAREGGSRQPRGSGETGGGLRGIGRLVTCKQNNTKSDTLVDVPQKAYMADFVFEGIAIDVISYAQSTMTSHLGAGIVFEMKQAIKADVVKLSTVLVSDYRVAPLNVTVLNFSLALQGQGHWDQKSHGVKCKAGVWLGQTYIVYANVRRLRHSVHVLTSSAFPDVSSKEVRRTAKSVLCSGCARVPRVIITPSHVNVTLTQVTSSRGTRVKLECEVSALPLANVQWLIGDTVLTTSEHFSIKRTRKGSRLTFKDVSVADSALYTCQANNILGQGQATAALRVLPPSSSPSTTADDFAATSDTRWRHKVTCSASQYATFCLHGGTCYQLRGMVNSTHCHCTAQYTGRRCEEERSVGYDLRAKTSERGQPSAGVKLKLDTF